MSQPTDPPRNQPAKSGRRDHETRFQPGNPGKPVGARNRATAAAAALLDGEAEALTRTAIDKALEGDTVALRICLERLVPPRKDAPITFAMPPVESPADTLQASAAVLVAVANGEITPEEAGRVMALLTAHRAIVETSDLEARIAALENAGGSK